MNTASTRLTLAVDPQERRNHGGRGLAARIAAAQPKPEPWKPAWMRRLSAKDMTGRVLA